MEKSECMYPSGAVAFVKSQQNDHHVDCRQRRRDSDGNGFWHFLSQ